MRASMRLAGVLWLAGVAGLSRSAEEVPKLIDLNDPGWHWRSYLSQRSTCVLSGTAVSELRDDAFELRFQRSMDAPLELFVLIPRLPAGGTVFMQAPTTHDRWRISTNNYSPALSGSQAESLRRNVAAGIPLVFTFEYGAKRRVSYETAPTYAISAAREFDSCVQVRLPQLKLQMEMEKAKK